MQFKCMSILFPFLFTVLGACMGVMSLIALKKDDFTIIPISAAMGCGVGVIVWILNWLRLKYCKSKLAIAPPVQEQVNNIYFVYQLDKRELPDIENLSKDDIIVSV